MQSTSDHGWNIEANTVVLEPAIERMRAAGIRVSLFINAEPTAPAAAAMVGADRVELYTGPYGGALKPAVAEVHLQALKETADAARSAGENARPGLKRAIPDLAEVSIGHALTADALLYGYAEAVRRYKVACG
jgi:pyridoxine 5-phosphate synthase